MEKINNNFENNSDKDSVCDNEREITIFISRIGNRVYTYTNKRSGVPEQLDEEAIKNKNAEQIKSIHNIVDISTITKGKSSNEIAMIAIKCLNPAIYIEDLSKIQFSKNDSIIEERPDIQSEFNDDPFNLKCRKRYQKLTDSQIRFLKFRINESILTTREISN